MHIEILVEDSSGEKLLELLIPKIIGGCEPPPTWRIHSYKGIGRIPTNLRESIDPSKRVLLEQLPRILRGYGRTPGIDAVVVVVDTDDRDCEPFLLQLNALLAACSPVPNTLIRLAIEELEAWYFGDQTALLQAYPRAKRNVLQGYVQDSVCGTWEKLADAVYPGGSSVIRRSGWPLPGQVKHEWATKIGPLMNTDANASPSFQKFRNGLINLIT